MSGYQQMLDFLRHHMLTCPSRKWLHMDCPGCGMQRSILSLLDGRLEESLRYHPAAIPLLLLFLFLPLHLWLKPAYGTRVIIGLQATVAILSAGFYVYKITHHQILH